MSSPVTYHDRSDAGRRLAEELGAYVRRADVQVYGIPRGGVPVAWEVAVRVEAPLDVVVVRKLGLPVQPELAMGAIASGGIRFLNSDVLDLGVSSRTVEEVTRRETIELKRRERLYRGGIPALDPGGKTAILVDDGLATGSTMRAAIASVRARGAAAVVVAVPVGAASTCAEIERESDAFFCPLRRTDFMAVGEWYEDFRQTTDDEVRDLLERSRKGVQPAGRR
ncbi:MAG TPA: phosphoribosyltransferase family protein [Patescibacteria group bacterium]|nr:phosphoribosyltransferase family protein [Patescibacteria group bacterium]